MKSREAGYTLVETLVAFVILSTALAGFYQSWSIAAHGLVSAEQKSDALQLSSFLLESIGSPEIPLAPGLYQGNQESGLWWQVEIIPYSTDPSVRLQLMAVQVEVRPSEAADHALVELTTLRMGGRVI